MSGIQEALNPYFLDEHLSSVLKVLPGTGNAMFKEQPSGLKQLGKFESWELGVGTVGEGASGHGKHGS